MEELAGGVVVMQGRFGAVRGLIYVVFRFRTRLAVVTQGPWPLS